MSPNAVRTIAAALTSLALLSGPQWAVAQDDLPAKLTTLLNGHVYSGLVSFKKEKIVKVQFAPSPGILAIKIDDAEETAPITAIVPLREIAGFEMSRGVAVISCRQPSCIKLTAEDFLPAVAKLTQNPGAKLAFLEHRSFVEFGYKAENANSIIQAIGALIRTAKAPPPNNPIGTCWIEEDGTIVLDLRRTADGINISMRPQRFARTHPRYNEVLIHVGPLRPGEIKLVQPWPN